MTSPDHHPPEQAPPEAIALMRMVDFRIPLPWLLGGFIFGIALLIGMYYKVQQMGESLQELQVTVKAGNLQAATVAGELALLKYRVEALESANRQAALPR